MIKAIIFDFDGVILDSVSTKTEAFRKLFMEYPQHIGRILEYHMTNGGLSRYEKFKVIYRDILKKELAPDEMRELGEKFTNFSYDAVIQAPFIKGAKEFLNEHHKDFLLFVASGTPHEEMVSIVKDRKLEKFFKGIYGSPLSKTEIIEKILRENFLKQGEVVFVGDSINDLAGARQSGIR